MPTPFLVPSSLLINNPRATGAEPGGSPGQNGRAPQGGTVGLGIAALPLRPPLPRLPRPQRPSEARAMGQASGGKVRALAAGAPAGPGVGRGGPVGVAFALLGSEFQVQAVGGGWAQSPRAHGTGCCTWPSTFWGDSPLRPQFPRVHGQSRSTQHSLSHASLAKLRKPRFSLYSQ